MTNSIYQWSQRGHIYLWKYLSNTKNFPGYHMSWDEEGKSSLLSLLECMAAQPEGESRSINLSAPSKEILLVPNNGVDVSTKKSIKVFLSVESKLEEVGGRYLLYLTSSLVNRFVDEARSVKSGREVSLVVGDKVLNYWW